MARISLLSTDGGVVARARTRRKIWTGFVVIAGIVAGVATGLLLAYFLM